MENFGLIFHWGLYSVSAYDDILCAKRRKMQNGSEWYKKRLLENSDYRPISGHIQTKDFHEKNFKNLKYEDFSEKFTAENWNPYEWMFFAKSIGASYVILTSKHHDGFCLWNTKTTLHNSCKTASKLDILKMFETSAKKFGLKFGIYYSWCEFGKNFTIDYVNNVVEPQIKELVKYNPDIWWFDGHWEIKTKYATNKINNIIDNLKKINLNVEINDRIPDKNKSTFFNFTDRYIPTENPNCKWEHINTLGYSWGLNKEQKEKDYKTVNELCKLYEITKNFNGNFLLNLGPDADGTLCKHETELLKKFYNTNLKSDNKESN